MLPGVNMPYQSQLSLTWILSDKHLTLDTKLHMYQTLVVSVLLYAADTWTLLAADVTWNSTRNAWDDCSEFACTAESGITIPATDQPGFTVSSRILLTYLSVWACGSARWKHTCKQGSPSPCQHITQSSSWPHMATSTWSSMEQVARPPQRWFQLFHWRPLKAWCLLRASMLFPICKQLECGPMPNVMVALPNIGGALCSTPQSLADAHY